MAEVAWSASAVTDLETTVDYLAQNSKPYAAAFAQKVLKAVERLGTFPWMGRMVPEYDREELRELIFQNYRIIYRVEPGQVAIAAIVHASRDLLRWYPLETWEIT